MKAIYYDYIDKLNPDIKKSIGIYTTFMSDNINEYLEKNLYGTDEKLDCINDIDLAFINAPPLSKSLIVYRGI